MISCLNFPVMLKIPPWRLKPRQFLPDAIQMVWTQQTQVLCKFYTLHLMNMQFFSNAIVTNGTAGDQTLRAVLFFQPGKLQIFALFQVYIGYSWILSTKPLLILFCDPLFHVTYLLQTMALKSLDTLFWLKFLFSGEQVVGLWAGIEQSKSMMLVLPY